ncbi:MAG: hemerythrin domain-containing protein [Candidatus Binatia bacterium]
MNATQLLKRQHRQVKQLFSKVEKTEDADERRQLMEEIAKNLEMHMHIEEEIFYPAVAEAASSKKIRELVPEAYEEHHVVKLVIGELPSVDPEDERFEAKMTVLQELVDQHVEEEEKEMFPAAEKQLGKERLQELGAELEEATAEAGSSEDVDQELQPTGRGAGRGQTRGRGGGRGRDNPDELEMSGDEDFDAEDEEAPEVHRR